ncbi:uncharacterized protein STEHIDRAFT_109549 [Stereum hirsutum FP-91666 SS1]|uniref:uncharacterized protein n=1 Tax=Stereum hirsutum (strain FP-91666) TaxID=721885 RepID=UPI000440FD7D|nr:uncharacterized protein STEHIDRAFT_109549 [Stereum hirsutum FP-91666 SS1]EIM89337.1 hypothetical protein STEHIDRAFT_109549 [Stereum hirsutum FP-91666 SS1]
MANTPDFSDIWNEAVDKHKSETKSDSLPLDSLGTTNSVEAILTAIAGNRKDFEDSRAKGKSLRDVLKPVVKVVQLMAEVAGEGANLAFSPGKTIFVAIGVLLKASDGVSKCYDSVIDIFESLESFLGRLTTYLEHDISCLMKEVIVKILAHLLSILGVATRLIRERRAVTYLKTLIGKNSEVQVAMEKLDKLTAQEGRAVATATLSSASEIRAVATATLSAASEILSQLETRMKSDQQDANAIKTMLMKIAQEAEAISGSSQEGRIMLEEIREHIMKNSKKVLPYLANHHRFEVHKWLFRWVFCQLDSIRGCPNARTLTKCLDTLPKTLYETYDRILKHIDDQHFEYVHATLQWLAFSMRPVKLEEVVEVLAMDFDNVPLQFVPGYRFPEPREILTICSSLVTLSGTGVLELSHFSVKEYLDTNMTECSIQRYSFNAQIAHEFIARTCIAYLMQFTQSVDDIGPFPLARYAAEHWMNHVGSAHTDALAELAFNLLQAHSVAFVNLSTETITATS